MVRGEGCGLRQDLSQRGDLRGVLFRSLKSPTLPHLLRIIHCVFSFWCRNPTLAKCGGEAQHLEKVRGWSPPGLLNVQSSIARPKTPCIGVFLVSLERS